MTGPSIVVVGSINIDLVARSGHIPRPGETLIGRDFQVVHGGKGANQAVAAARLGANVQMIGCVGDDDFGRRARGELAAAGVESSHIKTVSGVATGVALIVVADSAENSICVVPGANARLSLSDISAAEGAIASASVCVVQLEIPLEAVLHTVDLARRHGVAVILDPAPAPEDTPPGLLHVDTLTPNETEAARLLGQRGVCDSAAVARGLRAKGARTVVLKLGSRGAFFAAENENGSVRAPPVHVVDTTAAGDAFTAALAVSRAHGKSLHDAVRFAVAAGALACTRFGAQPSMPTLAEVEQLVRTIP